MGKPRSILRSVFHAALVFMLFGSFGLVPASAQTPADSAAAMMNKGYNLISSSPQEAIALFKDAVRIDPANIGARRQLGYLLASAGDHEGALGEFSAAELLMTSDTIQLQMAYSLYAIGETDRAKSLFFTLETSSPQPDIRKAASAAMNTSFGTDVRSPIQWGHVYASPYYDSRWESFFGHIAVYRGFSITSGGFLNGYGMLQLTGDTKSRGGTLPEIFADNAVVAALGVRFRPWKPLHVDIQQGIAYDLVNKGDRSRLRGDFRAIAVFGTGLYPDWPDDGELHFPCTPLVDLYSSAGYYSRFDNAIGYLQLKGGIRCFEAGGTTIDAYARVNGARDGNREFYNNILEWGGGLRLIPVLGLGVYLDLEYLRGRYYTPSPELPYDGDYDSFRAFLIFERAF